jgi:hypothetical protein
MKSPPKNIASSLRNRYRTAIRHLVHSIEQADMAGKRRLAHKGIHKREQVEAVLDAVRRFKEAVPFLFEEQGADSLPADFDIFKVIESAQPIEKILAAGEQWQKENPKILEVLRAYHNASGIWGEDAAADWMSQPNTRLDGRIPENVIEEDEGGFARVDQLLQEIREAMGHVPSASRAGLDDDGEVGEAEE